MLPCYETLTQCVLGCEAIVSEAQRSLFFATLGKEEHVVEL
jgi:hypothetical protein